MKRVALPGANDQALLTTFTTLQQSAAAVAIAPLAAGVLARYQAYVACGGNPWLLPTDGAFGHLRESFNGTYKEELAPFHFIAALRSGYDGACPVCGGSGTG